MQLYFPYLVVVDAGIVVALEEGRILFFVLHPIVLPRDRSDVRPPQATYKFIPLFCKDNLTLVF